MVFFLFRKYLFLESFYTTSLIILEDIPFDFYINKDLFLGILAVISRFSLKGFVEDLLDILLQPRLTIGDLSSPLCMNTDPNINHGGGSGNLSGQSDNSKLHQKVIDSIFTDTIKLEFLKFQEEMASLAKSLKGRRMMFDLGNNTLDKPDVPGVLVMMLQDQTQFLNASILKRIE
jgi:hypothetical protein